MRNTACLLCLLLFTVFTLPTNSTRASSIFINRIEGRVYDPNRLPVENVYVELLNDVESMLARARTTASGRFTFSGMPAGRFIIKVLPLGTNFMEQTQEVQITNITRTSSDTAYLDIYLRYDNRRRAAAVETTREIVFVQEVPSAAKKLYEDGIANLPKNQEKGLTQIEEAIKAFPQYFDALNRLGREYIARQKYEQGYPYLLRAIDVNSRSFSSYYGLGYAFYQLKEYAAALKATQAAILLAPDSIDAQTLHGTVLRITGNYLEAEKALLKANELAKTTNAEVHWQLALLYNKLNRNQDTINELQTYLKLVPDSPDKKKIQEMITKLKNSTGNKQ